MATIQTPISAAETKAQMESSTLNPEIKVGGSEASGGSDLSVTVNLHFAAGLTFKPVEIYEALDAKFGTVASMDSTVSRGTYNLLISA